MSNPVNKKSLPVVEFQHDGQVYTLKYNVRAICALQDLWNLADMTGVQERLEAMKVGNIKDIVDFVWAGLQSHHRDLTIDDVMDLIDDIGIDNLDDVLGPAFDAAMPDDAAEADDAGGEGEKKTAAA